MIKFPLGRRMAMVGPRPILRGRGVMYITRAPMKLRPRELVGQRVGIGHIVRLVEDIQGWGGKLPEWFEKRELFGLWVRETVTNDLHRLTVEAFCESQYYIFE